MGTLGEAVLTPGMILGSNSPSFHSSALNAATPSPWPQIPCGQIFFTSGDSTLVYKCSFQLLHTKPLSMVALKLMNLT